MVVKVFHNKLIIKSITTWLQRIMWSFAGFLMRYRCVRCVYQSFLQWPYFTHKYFIKKICVFLLSLIIELKLGTDCNIHVSFSCSCFIKADLKRSVANIRTQLLQIRQHKNLFSLKSIFFLTVHFPKKTHRSPRSLYFTESRVNTFIQNENN